MKARLAVLTALGVLCLLAAWFVGSAFGHDPFTGLRDPASNHSCCNKNDCQLALVRETNVGYQVVSTGEVIPSWRVLWKSQDGRWYRCAYPSTGSGTAVPNPPKPGSTRCLIGPPQTN